MDLRKNLSFGFETTFTIANWWQEPGFCSAWETPHKLDLMKRMSEALVSRIGGKIVSFKDSYNADGFELFDDEGRATFKVTSEPGSIEINTPPALVGDIRSMMDPLFAAAEEVGLVTYRTWWYGWKSGTSGGCHVNMAGFSDETNPWKQDPLLVLKYFAYFHNRPWLHYPFMGPDIGRGGNCMRMDEHGEEVSSSMLRFEEARAKVAAGWRPDCDELYEFFAGVPLRDVKHSAPTFRKVRKPYYLVEDRAMEMLRDSEECFDVCELRVRILEKLQKEEGIEELKKFDSRLHEEELSSIALFSAFSQWASEFDLDPEKYRKFFDRQFPALELGPQAAKRFAIREGRRERKVVGVNEAAGTLILSKKVDTRFKRFEFHLKSTGVPEVTSLRVNGRLMKPGENGILLDVYIPFGNERSKPILFDLEALDREGRTAERAVFDPNSMMFVEAKDSSAPGRRWANAGSAKERGTGYYRVEEDAEFAVWPE